MKYLFLLTDIPTNSTEGAIKELRSKRSMSRTEVKLYAHSITLYEDESSVLVHLESNRSARMTFCDFAFSLHQVPPDLPSGDSQSQSQSQSQVPS